jgi:LacI family transcriptional regulator
MASIKDVARLAGVSIGSVSNVINGKGSVKQSTRSAVEKAIAELDFKPNEVARNLKTNTTRIVALLLPNIHNSFFSKFAYYIEDELDKYDYKLMLCNSGGKPEKERNYLKMLQQQKVAGIVGITYNEIDHLLNTNIPMIGIDRDFGQKIMCVTSDNYHGGQLALEHLYAAGCRNVVYVGGQPPTESQIVKREDGFREAARVKGIVSHSLVRPDPLDFAHLTEEFMQLHADADGIFVSSDNLAAYMIERMKMYGIKVPEDLKVIGYDGVQDENYFHPILATIVQPVEEMARAIVQLLFQKIENPEMPSEIKRFPVVYRAGETI